MADPKGFLKVPERELPKRRPVPVRIMDWKEVYENQDHEVLKATAAHKNGNRQALRKLP